MAAENQAVPEIESPHTTWLTPKQAGAIVGVSGRMVAKLAARGELTAIMTAYGRLIEPTQLAAYAERHQRLYKMDLYRKDPLTTEQGEGPADATQEGRQDG